MNASPADGLFVIVSCTTKDDVMEAMVRLDASHAVFAGHFPGQPILPGVMSVRIALAVAERALGQPVELRGARSIKFLAPVDPRATPDQSYRLRITRGEQGLRLNAEASVGGVIVFKMSADVDVIS